MVEADSHLKLLPISILDIYTMFEHVDMLSIDILSSSLTQSYCDLALIWGFWITCGVKMMSLHHGSG
jgi:hypothetical protein